MDIIEKVKVIVAYFHRSVIAADLLRKLQCETGDTPLKLIQSVPTRWNSTYFMLERFLRLKDFVNTTLFRIENSGKPNMLPSNHIDVLIEALKVLEPLVEITNEVSAENYVTSSKIIPIIYCFKNKLNLLEIKQPEIKKVQKTMMDEICSRFSKLEQNLKYAAATIMDPRFKKMYLEKQPMEFVKTKRYVLSNIMSEVHHTVSNHNEDVEDVSVNSSNSSNEEMGNHSIWDVHENLRKIKTTNDFTSQKNNNIQNIIETQLNHYLSTSTIPIKNDPISFWMNNRDYNFLTKYALKTLSVMVTSVPSERLFSKASIIMDKRRNRIQPETLQKLLFLSALSNKAWEENYIQM